MKKIILWSLLFFINIFAFSEIIDRHLYGTRVMISIPDSYEFMNKSELAYQNKNEDIVISYEMIRRSIANIREEMNLSECDIFVDKLGENEVYKIVQAENTDVLEFVVILGNENETVCIYAHLYDTKKQDMQIESVLSILFSASWYDNIPRNFQHAYFFSMLDLYNLKPIMLNSNSIFFTPNGVDVEHTTTLYEISRFSAFIDRETIQKYLLGDVFSNLESSPNFITSKICVNNMEGYKIELNQDESQKQIISFFNSKSIVYIVKATFSDLSNNTNVLYYDDILYSFKE